MLGFIIPEEGTCLIEGMDCSKKIAEIQKKIGYIPGEINLMEEVTGIQFIKFMAEYRGMKDLGRAEEIIERFDLDPHVKIKKMSKGMKQKIGLVVAFMHDPAVFILDEPTRGIDVATKAELYRMIQSLADNGIAILMISSELPEIVNLCTRVLVMYEGRITADIKEKEQINQINIMHYAVGGVK